MTAHAMAGDEQKSLDAGMDGHVTKPIDPDKLFAALKKWVKPVAERAVDQKKPAIDPPLENDQAVRDEDDLPASLPEFDIAAGLQRLMGNKRLYRKLLVNFGTQYTETANDIRKAIDANDFEQAHSLVHNLEGLAGNLEAGDLQAATVGMEKVVKGQAKDTVPASELNLRFSNLEDALNRALEAVQTLGSTAKQQTIDSSVNGMVSQPPVIAKETIDRIKELVEMGDVMQIKSIAEELTSDSDALAPFCSELIRLAEDFDLDGIQKLMLASDS
jgi:HPt (histidine-containing phosphotransfer) domain-containing protein